MVRTELRGTNLSSANLEGANLSRADLTNANLTAITYDDNTKLQGAKFFEYRGIDKEGIAPAVFFDACLHTLEQSFHGGDSNKLDPEKLGFFKSHIVDSFLESMNNKAITPIEQLEILHNAKVNPLFTQATHKGTKDRAKEKSPIVKGFLTVGTKLYRKAAGAKAVNKIQAKIDDILKDHPEFKQQSKSMQR